MQWGSWGIDQLAAQVRKCARALRLKNMAAPPFMQQRRLLRRRQQQRRRPLQLLLQPSRRQVTRCVPQGTPTVGG